MTLRSTCLILTLFAAQSLLAEEHYLTETDLFSDLPVVVNATGLRQDQSTAPAAITIIVRAMIDASGAVEIADLLRLVPGFQVYQIHANKFGAVNHGVGDKHPRRLEVMVDGRSVYLPLLSTVDWVVLGITLADIDRIEVVRSTNVPTQGSNAFQGAINIITRNPLQDIGTTLSSTQGALDTHRYTLRHNDSFGAMDTRLILNYRSNNGSGMGLGDGGDGGTGPKRLNDDGEIKEISFRGVYTPSLIDSFDIQLGYSGGYTGVGNAEKPDLDRRDVTTSYQSLLWERRGEDDNSMTLHVYHNYLKYEHYDPFFVPENFLNNFGLPNHPAFTLNIGEENGVTERFDAELRYQGKVSSTLRYMTGFGARQDTLRSEAIAAGQGEINEAMYRLFSNMEWTPVDNWTLNLGAMLEHNNLVGTHLSPRLAINVQVHPDHSLRMMLAEAYRNPSLLEEFRLDQIRLPYVAELAAFEGAVLDTRGFSSGNLEPERLRTLELGYLWRDPQWNSLLDLKVYIERIDDGLTFHDSSFNGDSAIENGNDIHWRSKGADLSWRIEPWTGSWLHLAYAYNDMTGYWNRNSDPAKANGRRLDTRVPLHTLSALLSHDFGAQINASLAYYRMTSVEWFNGGALDPYDRLDLRLAKGFTLGATSGSIELIVHNLLKAYPEFFDRNSDFDTRTYLRGSVKF